VSAAPQALPAFSDYATVLHYGRFSGKAQASGSSEERQTDLADQWAARHGVTFTTRLMDRAMSGFHGVHRKRGDFGTLLQLVKDNLLPTPALLVLVEGDRAGREDVDIQLESLVLGLLRGGVDLYVVDSNLHLNLEKWRTDLGAQIQLQAMLHGANQYSRRLSARMKDAHARGRDRIKAGTITRPGWAPSWIDLVDGQWTFNDTAATVRRVLELLHHHGYNATANRLTAEGLQPPRNKRWTQGNVASLVKSEAVAGGRVTLRRDPSSVVWDYYPALMPKLEWQALLARIAARDGSASHSGNQQNINFIGQGITICATCGRAVGGRVSSYRQKDGTRIQRRYVRCRGRQEQICSAAAVPLDDIHHHLLSRLKLTDLARLFPQQQQSTLTTLQGEITTLQQQVEQQLAVVANGQQQISILLASSPDAVPVVAQAVTAAQQQVEQLQLKLHSLRTELRGIEGNSMQQLSIEVQQQVAALQQLFLNQQDGPDDRRQINVMLRRLELCIHLDQQQQQVGLSIADGPVDWQPLDAALSRIALHMGGTELVVSSDGSARFEAAAEQVDEEYMATD
jgi:hypothetical protein